MGKMKLPGSLLEDMVWPGLEPMSVKLRVCEVDTVAVLSLGCLFCVAWPCLVAGRLPAFPGPPWPSSWQLQSETPWEALWNPTFLTLI